MSDANRNRPSSHELARQIIDSGFGQTDGELLVDGVKISQLAEEFGTPSYVYSERVLKRQLMSLREALPQGRFRIHYSVKANPAQAVLNYFLKNGCGLEVASAGEIHQALAAGCQPDEMLFAGPGKTDAELQKAVELGIGEIHVESEREIERLGGIASAQHAVQKISLRINPAEDAAGGAMRMGGRPAAFGIDEEDIDEAVFAVLRQPNLVLSGIHLFTGTQILDAETLLKQYQCGVRIACRVAEETGLSLETIDFGGGLGIPYFPHETAPDLEVLKRGLLELTRRISGDSRISAARLILEPGRFLAGPCGIYVARVLDVKVSRGQTFVVLDGGMQHHLGASGNLGQTIKRNFPLTVLNRLEKPVDRTVNAVGPLCTPLDTLGRNVELPAVIPGDLIGVFQSGAYARTASPLGFLSHPTPPEVWVRQGQAQLIRRRGRPEDYLADQLPDALETDVPERITTSPALR